MAIEPLKGRAAGRVRSPAQGIASATPLAILSLSALLIQGCSGRQSALEPAGRGAEQLAELFWWMAGGAAVIWLLVVGLAFYAVKHRPRPQTPSNARTLVIGGGVVFPTIILALLLGYGLQLLASLLERRAPATRRIEVTGEQWWWRVRYLNNEGPPIELANEIRLPVGETVAFELHTADVIHAFWIPSLGGKVDMIPGRITRLVLHPTRTGVFRGICAEYCGGSHALMAFDVVVVEPEEFQSWLEGQRNPALSPISPEAQRGSAHFLSYGCGACHSVRGTPADGRVGPDLTHLGSRLTLGASLLRNNPEAIARWIAEVERLKPAAHMPSFGMIPAEDLRSIAAYLAALR